MKWQGYIKWVFEGGNNWRGSRYEFTKQYPTFGETQDAIELIMKDFNVHPDTVTVYKIWLVGRNRKFLQVTHCGNASKRVMRVERKE